MAASPQIPEVQLPDTQQTLLLQSIEAISGELHLQPLLSQILREVCRLVDAPSGLIGQVSSGQDRVCAEVLFGPALVEPGAEFHRRDAASGAILSRLLESKQPLSIPNYQQSDPHAPAETATWAVAGLPIWANGTLIAICMVGAPPPRRFTPADLALLERFVRFAGPALANARRFEAEQKRSVREVILNRVGRLISSSLSLDAILQNTVHSITDELPAVSVGVLLVNPEDPQWLVLRASSGPHSSMPTPAYSQHISTGIIGAAARSRQPVLVPDVTNEPRYLALDSSQQLRSELAVPIVGATLLGVLNIESEEVIGEDEVEDFKLVADQLAVAIEHANLFAATQRALEEAKLLFDTSRRISDAPDVDGVIRAYLDQVAARQRYACSIVLYEFDDKGERCAVIMRGRWQPGKGLEWPLAVRLEYARDNLDEPLDRGETIRIADVHTDPICPPGLRVLQERDGRPALALIPMMVRSKRIGLVILSAAQVHAWHEEDLRPYQITAAQLATAIDSRLQQAILAGRNQQLAIWDERRRLARELHDSVTQLLFSMTLIAQSLAAAWRRQPEEGERRTKRLLELSQNALAEMRALLRELRPPDTPPLHLSNGFDFSVAQRELVSALRTYVDGIARDGLQVELSVEEYRYLGPEREHALFRIAQEALHNATKHAAARHVQVRLLRDDSGTRLIIQDDGIGFEVDGARSGGMGLQTMRERAESLGGTFRIQSAPGAGTIVEVLLPAQLVEGMTTI